MTAIYQNKATKETYKLGGVSGIEQAWNMANFVCNRNNWNIEMFHTDVRVSIKQETI
jgi:hypothetical protein